MVVFLDLDGVLVDFVGAACGFHGADNPYDDPARHAATAGQWALEKLLGIDPEPFWAPFGFNFWSQLPWAADGRGVLALAERHFGPERVCLLSSPCLTPGCLEGKRAWVERELPAYARRYLLGPPKELAAGPGKLLIDDSDRNADLWAAAGGVAVLVARPWNRGHRTARAGGTLAHLDAVFADLARDRGAA